MGLLVRSLGQYDASDESAAWTIYFYAGGLVASSLAITLLFHPYCFITSRIGMEMRIACCHLIYSKSLRLSRSAFSKTTIGQIVNLLSNDVNRFDNCLIHPPTSCGRSHDAANRLHSVLRQWPLRTSFGWSVFQVWRSSSFTFLCSTCSARSSHHCASRRRN